MSIGFLRTAQAGGERWSSIVKSALTALGPLPEGVNFGLVYVTQPLAEDFSSILTFLRETTPIKRWTGAIGDGLVGPLGTVRGRPSLVLMVATLPENSFQLVDSWSEPGRSRFLARQRRWLAAQDMPVALMHGDYDDELPAQLADLAGSTGAFVIGGVAPAAPGRLSGVLLGSAMPLVTGLTQGCVPLGPAMRVTEASDDVILTLDGRPALDQLRQQLPPEIARDLQLAAGIIHIGLPVPGTDRPDYLVRPLRAIDPTRGWLAVGGGVAVGDRLMFVQQDNASARLDMQRMLADIARRVGNRSIKGGIFISSAARGEAMFGSDHAEAGMITRSLGDFPLIGLISQGEFCHDRLYGVTAVLALVLG